MKIFKLFFCVPFFLGPLACDRKPKVDEDRLVFDIRYEPIGEVGGPVESAKLPFYESQARADYRAFYYSYVEVNLPDHQVQFKARAMIGDRMTLTGTQSYDCVVTKNISAEKAEILQRQISMIPLCRIIYPERLACLASYFWGAQVAHVQRGSEIFSSADPCLNSQQPPIGICGNAQLDAIAKFIADDLSSDDPADCVAVE